MTRPGIDIDWSKSLHRAQLVALRHHRKLQEEHRNASCRDGQKALREPRGQIDVVHGCISLIDRTDNRMRRPPIHNKRTI
jgi:hypothetical protein